MIKQILRVLPLVCFFALFFAFSAVCAHGAASPTVPVWEHKWGPWIVDVQPGCTAQGREHRTCTRYPNAPHSEIKYLPPLGHKWGPWITVRKPTPERTGLQERICERCGQVEKKSIAKLPAPALAPTTPAPPVKPTPPPAPAPANPANGWTAVLFALCALSSGGFYWLIRRDYLVIKWDAANKALIDARVKAGLPINAPGSNVLYIQ